MTKPLKRMVLVGGLLLLGLSGCGPAPADHFQQVLVLNFPVAPASLDPALARDQAMGWAVQQVFSTLVELDSTLQPAPGLATRWYISSDGLRYTFYLRQGVRFHPDSCFAPATSRILTAHDVVYSFSRVAHPGTASPGQWVFNGRLRGLDAYQAGQADTVAGLYAPDDTTLVLELTGPYPPLLAQLTMPYTAVVPREAVEKYGQDWGRHPVGTGPFRFKFWDEGQQLVLHRHEQYYLPGLPRMPVVQIRFTGNPLGALRHLLAGQLDAMDGLYTGTTEELFTPEGQLRPAYAHRLVLHTAPQLTTEYLGIRLNVNQRTPWQDVRVRRALAYAIDRPALVRYLRSSLGQPAQAGLVPPALLSGPQLRGFTYAPDTAAHLLAQAGYPGGRGLPPLQLTLSPSAQRLAELLQAQWAELGIQTEILALEGPTAREAISQGRATAWRASWVADYPDAENFLALCQTEYLAPAGPNTAHLSLPPLDSLMHAALRASPSQRLWLYRQADSLALTQAAYIPLFYYQSVRVQRPEVKGFSLSPHDALLDLRHVTKGPRQNLN